MHVSILDGFKVFDFNEGSPYASVTKNGITFNKSVVIKLGYPNRVILLINSDTKQIAIKPCGEEEKKSVSFYKEKKSGIISVRWNGKDLLNTISEMTGWNLEHDSYRVDGVLIKEENVMLFDFKKATLLS